jgi:hypothetical protein
MRTLSIALALSLCCHNLVHAAPEALPSCPASPVALPLRNCNFENGADWFGLVLFLR